MTRIYDVYVPSVGPRNAKIMAVGEAPGYEEMKNGEPFVGMAGDLFTAVLLRNGIPRESVFITNLSRFRPFNNDFSNLLDSRQLKDGIEELKRDIEEIKPNLIIALGGWPLKYLCEKHSITAYRGSILECTLVPGYKVLATLHPAYILRDAKSYPAFDLDIKKAKTESEFKEIKEKERTLAIEPTMEDLELYEKQIRAADVASADIESLGDKLACVGFAPSPTLGICVPFDNSQRRDMISRTLQSDLPLVFHYGFHDVLYLHEMGIKVGNWAHDTYIAQHVLAPELPNTLAYLTSIYTDIAYYKSGGRAILADQKNWGAKFANKNELWIYNCKDDVATIDIHLQQQQELDEDPVLRKFYEFEMQLARGPLFALSTTGMLIDSVMQSKIRLALLGQWIDAQNKLNQIVQRAYVKKPLKIPGTDVVQLLNAGSPKQVKELFYDELGIRARKKREGGATVDDDALVGIIAEAKKEIDSKVTAEGKTRWQIVFVAAKLIQMIRGYRKLLSSYIDIKLSDDGRARSIFKIGPETGRLAASKYIDDTGLNLETIPRSAVTVKEDDKPDIEIPIRSMYIARPGYVLVEIDFSQAESWIVAYLANEPQMKDALAKGVAHERSASFIYEIPETKVSKNQRYLGKKANHSLAYGSTYLRLAQSINAESDKAPYITVSNQEARVIYDKWHQAYRIKDWWQDIQHELERNNKTLYNLYGRPRTFFSQWGKDLFKEAYAHKPQSTVADHTNGAVHPELGIKGGMIEVYNQFVVTKHCYLINQSHDSIILEIPEAHTDEIVPQVIKLMKRPLVVGTEEFTIPVDCKIGNRWGELKKYVPKA